MTRAVRSLNIVTWQNFKRTLEIRLKLFDKIQVKVGKMEIPKRQSSIFNDSLIIVNLCNLNLELSNSHQRKFQELEYVIFSEFRNNRQQNRLFCKFRRIFKGPLFYYERFQDHKTLQLSRTWKICLFDKSKNTKNDKTTCSASCFIVYEIFV